MYTAPAEPDGAGPSAERELLPFPDDPTLPLFVYGNLKAGELGHGRVAPLVNRSEPASVAGVLWERDGMPLLTRREGARPTTGQLLWFRSIEGYEKVVDFEPASYYKWDRVECSEPAGRWANVLVARDGLGPAYDGGDWLDAPWTTVQDPLFRFGLPAVAAALRADGLVPFLVLGLDSDEWQRLLRLQSAYMLACSILERITLRVIPGKLDKPTASISRLGRETAFKNAVREVGLLNLNRSVGRADRPVHSTPLENRSEFAAWAYQIRSNIVHQGKSAWQEANLVRTALLDLHDVLRVYLLGRMPAFEHVWSQSDPAGMAHGWRIKQSPEYLELFQS